MVLRVAISIAKAVKWLKPSILMEAKKVGVRLGNWLTADQGKALLAAPRTENVRGMRDHAMLAILLGCGLRRSELVQLTV